MTTKKKNEPAHHAPLVEGTVHVSDDTLEETPARVLLLLQGIGKVREIRAILAKVGYTNEQHALGWELLQKASGYHKDEPVDEAPSGVTEATDQLKAWQERGFATASATLKHRHPAQHRFIFDGLTDDKESGVVVHVERFLARLDALDAGKEREGTREEDHKALATLAKRGIGPEERRRLGELVKKAQAFEDVGGTDEERDARSREAHRKALKELRAWYEEWSTIAHAHLTRKEHLIRVGLAQRKKTKNKGTEGNKGSEEKT